MVTHHDVLIIGSGSGNSILTPDYDDLDVAIVERGVFGGTCLNRGCIPSKMFVYAADVAELARHGPSLGVHSRLDGVDWPAIRDRVFGRIDPIAEAGEEYRLGLDHVTVYAADARFVDHKTVDVDGERVSADHIVVAVGARPHVPELIETAAVGHHTSDTIMRIEQVPERLVIVGGGYISAELAHVFGAFGSEVTIVNRGPALLRAEDDDIAHRYTELAAARFDLSLSAVVRGVARHGDEIVVELTVEGRPHTVRGDALLVATGRTPNGDQLDLERTGLELDASGYLPTDAELRTRVDGIWALGDVTNPAQLKHTANAEARVVAHNIVHPDDLRSVDLRFTPHAVFGHPQVASAGATERDLQSRGIPYRVATQDYGGTAYGWAMEDTTSFCKLLAHRDTRRLLGAHLIGPQASSLIQQLIQAMRFDQTVDQIARDQLYIHPALTEVVENALLGL